MTEPCSFRRVGFPDEGDRFATFLAASRWPYHGTEEVTAESILENIRNGVYTNGTREVWWIERAGSPVGIVQLLDMDDVAEGEGFPLFDLRIQTGERGRGIGTAAVRWLTRELFDRYPKLNRIEATTRLDNRAMRAVLEKCLFAQEGHYREAWPDQSGTMHVGVHYAILRRDWESGTVSPVKLGR